MNSLVVIVAVSSVVGVLGSDLGGLSLGGGGFGGGGHGGLDLGSLGGGGYGGGGYGGGGYGGGLGAQSLVHEGFANFDSSPINLGQVVGRAQLPPKVIRITKTVAIKVPVPYPVNVPQHIPYPVTVNKPYPVPVPKIVRVPEPVAVHQDLGGQGGGYGGGYGGDGGASYDSYNGLGGGDSYSQIPQFAGQQGGYEGGQDLSQGGYAQEQTQPIASYQQDGGHGQDIGGGYGGQVGGGGYGGEAAGGGYEH